MTLLSKRNQNKINNSTARNNPTSARFSNYSGACLRRVPT